MNHASNAPFIMLFLVSTFCFFDNQLIMAHAVLYVFDYKVLLFWGMHSQFSCFTDDPHFQH